MIGAVSPAARETWRITPVRIPLMELGRTMDLIVCQRVAPTFQQASRKVIGTEARASRVLAMMTGNGRHASVRDAARMDLPNLAANTNASNPNKAWPMLGAPAILMLARVISRANRLSSACSFR